MNPDHKPKQNYTVSGKKGGRIFIDFFTANLLQSVVVKEF